MASFRAEPNPGDLIEIFRIYSSHWALYVGRGYVIHLAPPDEHPGAGSSSMSSMLSPRGKVKRELLSDVVRGCGYLVNNHLELEYSPLPVNKIISSAEEMVGKDMAYGILSRKPEHFVTDLRYGTICNQKFHEEPRPGDLIEISRIGSSHWALYVGDGYVIHLAPPDEHPEVDSSSMSSVLSPRGMVKRELLSDVVGGCGYQVNNHLDLECSPLPVNKIISSAEEMVGKEKEYSIVNGNCEHFVTDLRYGKARSLQFHEEPRPGDLIEIPRIGSSHWALYVGDGYVIHLGPPDEHPEFDSSSMSSMLSPRGKVKRDLMSDVVGGCGYRVNNHLDLECSPLPVNKIISSAKEMVGKEMEYSLVNGNCEHFVTDLRYGKACSLQFRPKPKPGDMIEIPRTGYSHWALYVGDGYVIHLVPKDEHSGSGSSSIFSVNSSRGKVKRELLSDVVGEYGYQVNNQLDHEYSPLPVNKIIRSAEEMVGKKMGYSLVNWNCEHFVTNLRYGKARSLQVELVKTCLSNYLERKLVLLSPVLS